MMDPNEPMVDVVWKGVHSYWSTHCRHFNHEACKAEELAPGVARRPAQCKTCGAPCICGCHVDANLPMFDKTGTPITWEQWVARMNDARYRTIGATQVTNAADPLQSFVVSTMWSGRSDTTPPLIFQTTVWDCHGGMAFTSVRMYTDADSAHAGHLDTVSETASTMHEALIADIIPL